MRGLKEKGMEELAALKNRIGRQYGLGRIDQVDHDFLKHHLQLIEERINDMEEVDDA